MLSTQELRRVVEGMLSPALQPEDPERSQDLASEEDPDIKVELIDGVFHQLSIDKRFGRHYGGLPRIISGFPGDCDRGPDTIVSCSFISNLRIRRCFVGSASRAGSRARGG